MRKKIISILLIGGLVVSLAACGADTETDNSEPEGEVVATICDMDVYYEGCNYDEEDNSGSVYLNFDNSKCVQAVEIFIGPAETDDGEVLLNGDSISVDSGEILSSGFIYDADTDLVSAADYIEVDITVTYDDGESETETVVIEP